MKDYFDSVAATWDESTRRSTRAKATAKQVKTAPLKSRHTLVDFGGGTGLLSSLLLDSFEKLLLVDSSTQMRAQAQVKIDRQQISNLKLAKALPDGSQKVSGIVTLMALHHVLDLDGFFEDAAACIEQGGALMIADLYSEDGGFHHFEPDFNGHNGFDTQALAAQLKLHGFEVVEEHAYFSTPNEDANGDTIDYPMFFLTAIKR